MAALFAGGVEVRGADGGDAGRLDVGAINSNCTFGGRWLYITDFGSNPLADPTSARGVLWRVELEAAGPSPFRGQLS